MHYPAVKSLSRLLCEIKLKNNVDFINCLHAFRTENKLKSQESMCQNHDCCFIKMSEKCNKILKYDQDKQSMKIQFSFYIVTETLIRFSIRISIRFKAIAL